MKKSSIGSSFDDFLQEEGIYEEVQATAIKRVLSWKINPSEGLFKNASRIGPLGLLKKTSLSAWKSYDEISTRTYLQRT